MEQFIKEWRHGRRPVSGRCTTISQMAYPYQEFLPELEAINVQLETQGGMFSNQLREDLNILYKFKSFTFNNLRENYL